MRPHPHIQSPVSGGHIAAQLFLRGEAVLLPAASAQQKIENFTKHGGSPPFYAIIHYFRVPVNDAAVNNRQIIVYSSWWIYGSDYRQPLSLRGAKRRGNLQHSRRTLFDPINMVNPGFSMLSTMLRHQSTVQEIPTGLTALGMTSFSHLVAKQLMRH